jgi:hypothetical protein
MELAAYTFDPFRSDGEFLLARGRPRRQTGATLPSLLMVTPVAERPALASLRRMEHELALQAELEPGWAVRPLALTQDQGRSLLLLEDPGGEPLDGLLGAPADLRHRPGDQPPQRALLSVRFERWYGLGMRARRLQAHGRGTRPMVASLWRGMSRNHP